MNNLSISFQRFLKNKNTVTIIGIILILVLLYVVYAITINNAVNPVQIPVAAEKIQPRTKITSEMVEVVDIPAVAVTENVYQNKNNVVGKYSNVNAVIPKGSMFYDGAIVKKEELPDSSFTEVEEGDVVYNLSVTTESTYGNSIFPGNKIDVYMKAVDDATGKIMVGKLVKNIEVLAVKDKQGRHVFEDTEANRTPATLIFGVEPDINILLRKASYLSSVGVELFPVPHGGEAKEEGDVTVTATQLKNYIEAHTVNVQLDEITEDTENTENVDDLGETNE